MVDDLQENEDIGPSSNIPSTSSPSIRSKIILDDLHSDPADSPPITSYHPNQIDDVRRTYIVKKAFQPRGHNFKWSNFSSGQRRFNAKWFDKYDWLECSTKQEKAYCLCCYLFYGSVGNQGGREVFVSGGFWLFLAILKLICENNPDIGKYCLGNAKKNNKLTTPSIQKDIIDCFAKEVAKRLCEEFKDDVFGLLADESSDVS
ncbi:uncharacterized protein LOC143598426 [Bidens hawaiensis]|uniref:uncharacterized protein LOC143598426 n=1 Tax=Bidens hawaiensis TaxID=980011 RepID=UPI00404961F5